MHRATIEGYLAHKWNLQNTILPDSHPYIELDPFGIQLSQASTRSEGGDPTSYYFRVMSVWSRTQY